MKTYIKYKKKLYNCIEDFFHIISFENVKYYNNYRMQCCMLDYIFVKHSD